MIPQQVLESLTRTAKEMVGVCRYPWRQAAESLIELRGLVDGTRKIGDEGPTTKDKQRYKEACISWAAIALLEASRMEG